jgi:hypothetical protein
MIICCVTVNLLLTRLQAPKAILADCKSSSRQQNSSPEQGATASSQQPLPVRTLQATVQQAEFAIPGTAVALRVSPPSNLLRDIAALGGGFPSSQQVRLRVAKASDTGDRSHHDWLSCRCTFSLIFVGVFQSQALRSALAFHQLGGRRPALQHLLHETEVTHNSGRHDSVSSSPISWQVNRPF